MHHIYYIDMMKTVKGAFSVVSAVVLQALLSVGQLTNSVGHSPENYVVEIMAPALHVSEMKQVSLCDSARLCFRPEVLTLQPR